MSHPPPRFYAPPPSSFHQPPQTATANPAEVRSNAIATLKRAASIPRTPEGRRPPQNGQPSQGQVNPQAIDQVIGDPPPITTHPSIHPDAEEMLSPSPVAVNFDRSNNPPLAATSMQRTASSSSSLHIPTPPHFTFIQSSSTPYYSSSSSASATPDWAAMQLGQSYIPSLSPAGSPFIPGNTPALGRNTPSPLPTLGELRTLQRSNSVAARAHAMSKLTGGRETPSDEDHTIHASSFRPNLQRADSLGAPRVFVSPRVFDISMLRGEPAHMPPAEEPSVDSRPRLQRSFTVSSSNMGEERRSAVGRRMVERLAESRSARKREDANVRQLWEESRGIHREDGSPKSERSAEDDKANLPILPAAGPVQSSQPQPNQGVVRDMQVPPEGAVSRNTAWSVEEAFEYEAYLRRSLSSRTAKVAMRTTHDAAQGKPSLPPSEEELEQLHDSEQSIQRHLEEALPPPRPAYADPTRHAPQSSTFTFGTARGDKSSGGASTTSGDARGSMMFIMGRGSGSVSTGDLHQREGNWPVGVEDNGGSDWNTPAKDFYPTFSESPVAHSPLAPVQPQLSFDQPIEETSDDNRSLAPPRGSERNSVMSWEEVGGAADHEVPVDARYFKKSDSFSAKIERNIRTAMRKRSQSRSSVSSSTKTSPPTSPKVLATAIQDSSRRGSEASTSPSQASMAKSLARISPAVQQGEQLRHPPSMGSLSPVRGQHESSENSMLLQYQLSADPSPMAWLPRADINDPRIHSSKLSPFPGIANLERKAADKAPLDHPPLLHPFSDSVVPTLQRVTPVNDSIYALPLPVSSPVESRRASDDSASKRSWLAKALGQQTSPRSSGSASQSPRSVSRKGSNPDIAFDSGHIGRKPSVDGHPHFTQLPTEMDPFASPPLPLSKPTRHRSVSPAVSTVPELNEEGSRLTRFTVATQRHDNASPLIEEEESEVNGDPLPQKSMGVLHRMDHLLALAPNDPARPDILDDPPRKLLLATQVLQVVNVHTAKDRFLFLFNDILVIAKPLLTSDCTATLNTKYHVKSIVSLDRLHISGFDSEPANEPERHAVVQQFIQQFAEDPVKACRYLVERSNPRVDAITLASLIFKTSELDKSMIGLLLSGNDKLLSAFLDRFHFTGIRIDQALRMFLLTVRLPADSEDRQILLQGFAHRYREANPDIVPDPGHGEGLVLAIMQLNDSLYGMYGFALATHYVDVAVFVNAWRSKDPNRLVPDDLLTEIYASVRENPIAQALDSKLEKDCGRMVHVTPTRLPQTMTYNTWSTEIRVSITCPDEHLGIRLIGEGLEFDPPVLDFSHRAEAAFRVRGTSLGAKSMQFDRFGRNAPLYARVGNSRTFSVERAFMAHTFHVAFLSHTASKRKYCFSVPDAEISSKWGILFRRQIESTRATKSVSTSTSQRRIRRAAEEVALHVLRDAVIPPEEKGEARTMRSASVSVAYAATAGQREESLGPLQPTKPGVAGETMSGMVKVQTGKELVLLCRQNSLLPGLLELLQAGAGAEAESGVTYGVGSRHHEPEQVEHGLGIEQSVKGRVPGGLV